ncbi:MAG: hypothetical protein J7641_09865 [Cyanobacteria bacterium SID2]|nr:hypothetical protein [Cyanobacteria bacterium SID2]MBP0002134.1 hypothetical protein [Cyanobacteria bacterium SBC]
MKSVVRSIWLWAIAIAVFKLWAVAHLPIRASIAFHDNLRYVITATNLLRGNVPYGELTLVRQPGYPGFILLSYWLGLPLRISQEFLYLGAGLFLATAIDRWLPKRWLTLLFFAIYALAPFSYHWNRQTLQEVLYLPLTATILAGLLNLLKDVESERLFFQDSLGLGIALALFWNTRPEGIWIVPIVALTYGVIAIRSRLQNLRKLLYAAVFSIAPVIFVTSTFAFVNYLQYGLYNTYDLKSPGLTAAYSSLRRVSPERHRPQIAVPQATREEIYAVSPSFRRLQDSLEIEIDRGWRKVSCDMGICDDYAAGVFFWALRDAVEDEGYYRSALETEGFYQQIAREVDTACDRNLLRCKAQDFASFVPSLSTEILQPWLYGIARLSYNLTTSSLPLKLDSGVEDIELRQQYYAKITREPADFFQRRQQLFDRFKDGVVTVVSRSYQLAFPVLLGLAVLGFLVELVCFRDSRLIPLWLSGILLFCIVVRVVLVAYVDVTSWSVDRGDRYLRPVLPSLWLLMCIGVSYLESRWRSLKFSHPFHRVR